MAVVTISRQFGAGALVLGEKLCEKFGYKMVDASIINEVAKKAKVSPSWLDAMEKEASSQILSIVSSLVSSGLFYRTPSAPAEIGERKKYLETLNRIMTAMAEKGGYVIVGRGSQFILKDHPDAVHVLLVGGFDDRVRFVEEHFDLSCSEAKELVKDKEKQRSLFASNIFKADMDDPTHYHMALNTSRTDLDWATEMVSKLLELQTKKEKE